MISVLASSGCYKKYHELGGLNDKHLFLPVLDSGKSKVKVMAGLTSGHHLIPGLQTAAFWLYLHMAETEGESLTSLP